MGKIEELHKQSALVISLALTIVILGVYWQVRNHNFITYDDYEYVLENPHVRYGFTLPAVGWAFTSTRASNWHPLTWISHMLDCELFGLNPSGHHFNSLLLHVGNSLLLLFLLRRMTGALWRSAFVAALFALHPLHVESVAWVAERKDVLSTFFWFITLWAYVSYVEHGGISRYLLSLLFFAFGLMAKPMLVTVPFVLLLLDYWPLGRFRLENSGTDRERLSRSRLVYEKIPYFVLSGISAMLTFIVQEKWGAVIFTIPLKERLGNALFAYVQYVFKMIWPHELAFHYPHPLDALPVWQVVGSFFFLLFISFLSLKYSSRFPYITVGWLWYLATLVPVIGLIQVGTQGMADRYTYVPLVGPFILMSWGMAHLSSRWQRLKWPVISLSGFLSAAIATGTWFQVQYWKDSVTLYEHAILVTRGNLVAHNNLGNAFAGQGKLNEAVYHLLQAVKLQPDYAIAHNNLANVYMKQGKLKEAIEHYEQALRLRPGFEEARYNLMLALERASGPIDNENEP